MASNNRVQLSLTIHDETLMEELIKPYKSNKELTSLIERLLSAYYYNEEVRDIVDGEGVTDIGGSEFDQMQEYFSNIKKNLAVMSVLEDGLTATLDSGLSKIKREYGMPEDEMREWGVTVPNLLLPTELAIESAQLETSCVIEQPEKIEHVVVKVATHEDTSTSNRLSSLETSVSKLLSMMEKVVSSTSGVEGAGVSLSTEPVIKQVPIKIDSIPTPQIITVPDAPVESSEDFVLQFEEPDISAVEVSLLPNEEIPAMKSEVGSKVHLSKLLNSLKK